MQDSHIIKRNTNRLRQAMLFGSGTCRQSRIAAQNVLWQRSRTSSCAMGLTLLAKQLSWIAYIDFTLLCFYLPIRARTSSPSTTLPKTTCLPAECRQVVPQVTGALTGQVCVRGGAQQGLCHHLAERNVLVGRQAGDFKLSTCMFKSRGMHVCLLGIGHPQPVPCCAVRAAVRTST